MSALVLGRSPIATLGPAGTDAMTIAQTLGGPILPCDSFPDAMAVAAQGHAFALICAAYLALSDSGEIVDTWTRLHFRSAQHMHLVKAWSAPTKPMCVAIGVDVVERGRAPQTIGIHPATAEIATRALPGVRQVPFPAKPLAVAAAAKGEVDSCLGSVDVVGQYAALVPREVFEAEMVWCIYERRAEAS